MAVLTNTKEARLLATLTELSSTGKLRWTLKTPGSLQAGSRTVPSQLRYCYEADFGDSFLVLYDQSEVNASMHSVGIIGIGIEAMMNGKYALSIISKKSRSETLKITGRTLNDLYATVQSKAGDADSVIDELLRTAKGF